jgi:hypothetical protein
MFNPIETKSVGTSTELEGGYRLGNAVAQKATPIETQTIETQTEKQKRVKIPKQEKEEEGFGAMRGEALQELRRRVQAEPKPKTIEDYFPVKKPSSGGAEVKEEERARVDTAEAILGRSGGGGGFINTTIPEPDKFKAARTKKKQTPVPALTSVLQTLQEATNNAASAEGEQKIEFE